MKNLKVGALGAIVGAMLATVAIGGYVAARPAATKQLSACVTADGLMHLQSKPSNCPAGQKKVSWNVKGTKGARGAKGDTGDAVLDSVNCATGQAVIWTGSAWGCRTVAITAQLSIASLGPFGGTTHSVFNSYTTNVDDTSCSFFSCSIKLSDVQDHTSCFVSISGNSHSDRAIIIKSTAEIGIYDMDMMQWGEPVYISISCIY